MITPSEGAFPHAQPIDRDATKDLGHKISGRTHAQKPNIPDTVKPPNKTKDVIPKRDNTTKSSITKEVIKRKPSTRRISTRDRGPSRKQILKRDRKQIERYTAMLSKATTIHNDKCSRLNISTSTALAKLAYLSVIDG